MNNTIKRIADTMSIDGDATIDAYYETPQDAFDTISGLDIEAYEEDLANYGFDGATIQYRGFSSQGDGLCFDIDGFDFNQYLSETRQKTKYKAITKAIDEGLLDGYILENQFATHYCHENTRAFECEYQDYDMATDEQLLTEKQIYLIEELVADIEKKRLELCKKYYNELQELYYDLQK